MTRAGELEPLIMPPPVGWWPPAPGWWLLLALTIALLLIVWLRPWRHWQKARQHEPTAKLEPHRQLALEELSRLQKPYDGQPANQWLQQLNALLKRLCRVRYPAENPHTLTGRAWLAFLDNRCPSAGLTRWMVLVEGAYRAECRLDDKAIDGLEQAIQTWIRKHV